MPYKINGKRIRSKEEHRDWYAERNPNIVPHKPKPVRKQTPENRQIVKVFLFVLVVAINVLSMAHTVPTITYFYPSDVSNEIKSLVGIAGSIAIEGAIVLLMSLERRGKPENIAIGVMFFAAVVMNLLSTVMAVNEPGSKFILDLQSPVVGVGVGLLVGLVAPIANIAFGETLHNYSLMRREELKKIETEHDAEEVRRQLEYDTALGSFEEKFIKNYRAYLVRSGLEPETTELLLSGDFFEDDIVETQPEIPFPNPLTN